MDSLPKIKRRVQSNKVLKVKFEVDTDPPLKFKVDYRSLTFPGPFSVTTMALPDLFAGKMHALLFREYKGWVKGRDWYDFLWFLGQKIPLALTHLEKRMRQSGNLPIHQRANGIKIKNDFGESHQATRYCLCSSRCQTFH